MTRQRSDAIAYGVAGAAIVAFAVVLAFALVRLSLTEAEMRRNVGDNMLWAISRAQKSALEMDRAIALRAGVPETPVELERTYNVLLSRLDLLTAGPQSRYLEALGYAADIAGHYRTLLENEDAILGVTPGAVTAVERLHPDLDALASTLGRAANRSMVAHWDATGTRLDAQKAAIWQVIVSIFAIIALGIALSAMTLRAMWARQRAQRSLAREREIGDAYRSFVALVSHQFRTPLAVIDASMQRLIRRGAQMPAGAIADRARTARSEIAGLTRLIDTTLEAMRLDAGRVGPEMRPCDPRDLAKAVVKRQRAASPSRTVSVRIAHHVPSELVTDRILVEQVLGNLVSNAVKYSPETEPVTVALASSDTSVTYSVTDQGIGIPEAEQERLFHRFFRASTASGTSGFGIGLSVSAQLAQLLGGELTFTSRKGIGSTFTLTLPVRASAPGTAESAPAR